MKKIDKDLGFDLGFADRFIILNLENHKITKLEYKGRASALGHEYIIRHYDKDGYVETEKHLWNNRTSGVKQFYFAVK